MKTQNSNAKPDEFHSTRPSTETSDGLYKIQDGIFYDQDDRKVDVAVCVRRTDAVRYIIADVGYSAANEALGTINDDGELEPAEPAKTPANKKQTSKKETRPKSPLSKSPADDKADEKADDKKADAETGSGDLLDD